MPFIAAVFICRAAVPHRSTLGLRRARLPCAGERRIPELSVRLLAAEPGWSCAGHWGFLGLSLALIGPPSYKASLVSSPCCIRWMLSGVLLFSSLSWDHPKGSCVSLSPPTLRCPSCIPFCHQWLGRERAWFGIMPCWYGHSQIVLNW